MDDAGNKVAKNSVEVKFSPIHLLTALAGRINVGGHKGTPMKNVVLILKHTRMGR